MDEAGRGPLAGPLVAAAVILPEGFLLRGVDDSKKLNEKERDALFQELACHPKVLIGRGLVEAWEIDEVNIHNATLLAMSRAAKNLPESPDFLLVDGRHTFETKLPIEAVIGGDAHVQAIAAASIVAKTMRDEIMEGYDALFPNYGFKAHKGYGTKQHKEALEAFGPTPIHRRSFGTLGENKT